MGSGNGPVSSSSRVRLGESESGRREIKKGERAYSFQSKNDYLRGEGKVNDDKEHCPWRGKKKKILKRKRKERLR